jgi:hypothetical protein
VHIQLCYDSRRHKFEPLGYSDKRLQGILLDLLTRKSRGEGDAVLAALREAIVLEVAGL